MVFARGGEGGGGLEERQGRCGDGNGNSIYRVNPPKSIK